MNIVLNMILVFVTGIALGMLFFGGLWLTVKKTVTARKPAILILSSFIVRVAIVLLGFYFICAEDWQKILVAFSGFIIARFLMVYFTKIKDAKIGKEVNHET
jgi:F1F0 ATPase subunit 2